MREQTGYNKIVNIAEDGEITVLHYTFTINPEFKGATGNTFYPVSKRQYKEQTSLKAVIERLENCVRKEDVPYEFREHDRGVYKDPFKRWAKAIIEDGQVKEFMFDASYSELWDYLRETCGHSEDEAYIYECVSGGRIFDKDFQGNVNPELSAIIREYETK